MVRLIKSRKRNLQLLPNVSHFGIQAVEKPMSRVRVFVAIFRRKPQLPAHSITISRKR